jgi:hypothetical protein
VISQKKAKQSIYDYISLQLHAAGPHNKPGVPHNKPGVEKRKEQRRMKKERYDNNGY